MRIGIPRAFFKVDGPGWWRFTGLSFCCVVLWDICGLDSNIMELVGTPHGFPLRHNFWFEQVGHVGARNTALLLLLVLWLSPLYAPSWLKSFNRHERLFMAAGSTVCAILIATLKQFSAVSCPWDQATFGGTAHWIPHWAWWISSDGGPGRCFPGGHASSAFAFLAAVWPGLSSGPGTPRKRYAVRALWIIVVVGVLLGVVQTLRGAHPPGHTLWTAWLCWFSSGVIYALYSKFFALDKRHLAASHQSESAGRGQDA